MQNLNSPYMSFLFFKMQNTISYFVSWDFGVKYYKYFTNSLAEFCPITFLYPNYHLEAWYKNI